MGFSLGSAGVVDGRNSGAAISLSINVTGTNAGSAIIIGVRYFDPGATHSINGITVQSEGTATLIGSTVGPTGSIYQRLAYFPNLASGGTKQVTVTMNGGTIVAAGLGLWAFEAIGGNAASLFDTSATAAGASNATVDITAAVDNELVVAQLTYTSGTPTATSGYTNVTLLSVSTGQRMEYNLDAGAAGTKTLAMGPVFNGWEMVAAAFKPSAPAGFFARPYYDMIGQSKIGA